MQTKPYIFYRDGRWQYREGKRTASGACVMLAYANYIWSEILRNYYE